LWRELTAGTDLPQSVHISDWPSVNKPDAASHKMLEEMLIVRNFIVDGLAARAEEKIKVRQPLTSATLHIYGCDLDKRFMEIIKSELNVKEVNISQGKEGVIQHLDLDTRVTPELKAEGISRDLIRFIQNARKNAGFNVEDRIQLKLSSESAEITGAIAKFKDMIFAETLALSDLTEEPEHSETVKLEGQGVNIALKRA
jgi:isoleucyl-tRNA synthetase